MENHNNFIALVHFSTYPSQPDNILLYSFEYFISKHSFQTTHI